MRFLHRRSSRKKDEEQDRQGRKSVRSTVRASFSAVNGVHDADAADSSHSDQGRRESRQEPSQATNTAKVPAMSGQKCEENDSGQASVNDDGNDSMLGTCTVTSMEKAMKEYNKYNVNRGPPKLAGANIFVLAEEVDRGNEQEVRDAITRASVAIEALGGQLARTLDRNATHALWAMPTKPAMEENNIHIAANHDSNKVQGRKGRSLRSRERQRVGINLRKTFSLCSRLDVPIVELSWLDRVSALDLHWSQIDPKKFEPPIVALAFENGGGSDSGATTQTMKSVGAGTGLGDNVSPQHPLGRDPPANLGRSISETFAYLKDSDPAVVEEDAIRRAVELSLLDCALVYRKPNASESKTRRGKHLGITQTSPQEPAPHEILGVSTVANTSEIKAAYRRRARETHPDKGGSSAQFERVARAYRSLLNANQGSWRPEYDGGSGSMDVAVLKTTAHWDSELRDHQNLVRDLFQQHGADVSTNISKQTVALSNLGLHRKEVGASNRNERNELIRNSCFYLSLAASYLDGIGALTRRSNGDSSGIDDDNSDEDESHIFTVGSKLVDGDDCNEPTADQALISDTALQLKRVIEAAVVSAHPEWAERGMVGEEVQAFSDFLVYLLDSPTLIGDWAVVVFDDASGFVDVYKGRNYCPRVGKHDETLCSNTLTLRYTPGHYQPLLPGRVLDRPSLEEILEELDRSGVFYVITDGSA